MQRGVNIMSMNINVQHNKIEKYLEIKCDLKDIQYKW